MKLPINERETLVLTTGRVARMATADASGAPHVVPVCYAYDGRYLYTPIDLKPKRVTYEKLKRVKNIRANPRVSLVSDEYSEDWSRLYYVMITGRADLLFSGDRYTQALVLLCDKYGQYEEMRLRELKPPVICITPDNIVSWGDL